MVAAPARPADPARLPNPSEEEARWATVKLHAARWFARLQAAERPVPRPAPAAPQGAAVAVRGGRAR